ncbi:DUF262 domain-containing protein [Oscillatoria sp. FACHB-1406]|nr:DUF262 domain-containing protein [Oscillatoria sp. FACHB-1406]
MSPSPTIESRDLSLSGLFEDFYSVPDFQREYVWEKQNVQKLLEDLFDNLSLFEGNSSSNLSEYFLGSIVVCPDSTDDRKTFQLIDGQQRVTTLYLVFCALRYFILELGDKSQFLEELIQGTAQDVRTGDDINKYRLSLQYDSLGAKTIDCIIHNLYPEKSWLNSSRSAQNINTAWKVIKVFLADNVEDNPKRFKEICAAIANRAKIIRIETPNLKNALKVFETINERGVGLSSIDLLKNYLFIHTSSKDSSKSIDRNWSSLTIKWGKLLEILYQSNQEPLPFLRYYLLSHYSVEMQNNFPEEEIYSWFIEHGETEGIQKEPLKFMDELILAAEHYCKFTHAKNVDGSDNIYLKNIAKIQGRIKQHLILLMGGRFLEINLFNKLSFYVENLLFVNTITRKARRKDVNLTREFAQSARKLRYVKTSDDLNKFIAENISPKLDLLKEDFRLSLSELSSNNLAKFRLRYFLAKIDQFIVKESYGNLKPLESYLDKSITIEHILPQSKKDPLFPKLGNLTLLEKTINSSLSNKEYKDKIEGYRQSQMLITRSLVEEIAVGNKTQLNRAMTKLNLISFSQWDNAAIEQRQIILVNIAMKVWGLDEENLYPIKF